MISIKEIDNFLSNVLKTDTCWLWQGSKLKGGYGYCKVNRKTYMVHRLSWIIHKGNISNNLWVLHKCDIRNCVNPDHLFLGTRSDNMKDCAAKKRLHLQNHPEDYWGEKNYHSKLTTQDVLHIRNSSLSGIALANLYKVSDSTISLIRNNKRWEHLL